MPPEMTYARALNDAKQMIIQQQYRIKADAEKIRGQQQTIVDQSSSLVDVERRLREQAGELQRLTEDLHSAQTKVQGLTIAKEQAEAVIDRQGERLTSVQASAAELERQLAEQTAQTARLQSDLEALRAQLPTSEDEEALAAMTELLDKRPAALKQATLRLADDAPPESAAIQQAEAA